MSNKLFNVFNRKVSESDFIKIFGSIYEHSEWVPENIIKNNSVLPDTIENLGLRIGRHKPGVKHHKLNSGKSP